MGRFTIVFIASIALGIFIIPGVMSTFSGSHEFVGPGNVECTKCHMDIYDELASSVEQSTHAGISADGTPYIFECNECHTVDGIGANPGGGHAAQKVDCGYCHNKTAFGGVGSEYSNFIHLLVAKYNIGCMDCHDVHGSRFPLLGGGFMYAVYDTLPDPNSAHYQFYTNALNDDLLLGGTEACVGCHTHVDVTFTRPLGTYVLTYDPVTRSFGKE